MAWVEQQKREVRGLHWIERRVHALQMMLVLGHGIPQYFEGTNAIYQVLEETIGEKTYWD